MFILFCVIFFWLGCLSIQVGLLIRDLNELSKTATKRELKTGSGSR